MSKADSREGAIGGRPINGEDATVASASGTTGEERKTIGVGGLSATTSAWRPILLALLAALLFTESAQRTSKLAQMRKQIHMSTYKAKEQFIRNKITLQRIDMQ